MNIHIYPSPILNETRIQKITKTLVDERFFSEIEIIGKWEPGLSHVESIDHCRKILRISSLKIAWLPRGISQIVSGITWYSKALKYLLGKKIVCLNCHSLPVLPLCVLVKVIKGCKLIYDTHELESETVSSKGTRRLIYKFAERFLIRSADAICVVGVSIADWYQQTYSLKKVYIVKNIPFAKAYQEVPNRILRTRLNIPDNEMIFIYQGLLTPGRGIEITLDAFARASTSKHVVFLGYGDLKEKVKEYESRHSNIHYHEAVDPSDLGALSAGADVGIVMIESICLSYHLCFPNKLFEYYNSGLPMVASRCPDVASFVVSNKCGWVIDATATDLFKFIESLTIQEAKSVRSKLALSRRKYSWESEAIILTNMYKEINVFPAQD